jgi:hypothetical protein
LKNLLNNLLNKIKRKERVPLYYHPGIYKFFFPYASFYNVPDDNGYVSIHTCQIELYIGQEIDMKEGYIATIVICADNEGIGITNFFESIATKVRLSFFDVIFHEKMNEKTNSILNNIRWLQFYSSEYSPSLFPGDNWMDVKMVWDENSRRYHSPTWEIYSGYYSNSKVEISTVVGKIYKAELSLSDFPTLGNFVYVLVIECYKEINQSIVVPIYYYPERRMRNEFPLIEIGENQYGINPNFIFRFDKLRNVNRQVFKEEIGYISKRKLNELLNYWKTLNISQKEIVGFIPYRKKMIKDKNVEMEENRIYEFKSVTSKNPVKAISDSSEDYICAYLNSNGGKLFYGIDDNGKVSGVYLTKEDKDLLRQQINVKVAQIEPHIDPTSMVFYFHNVEDQNYIQLEDQYVVEIIVPPSYEKQLYFTGSNKAWIKTDGAKQQLRSTALVDYIKKNIL